MTFCDKCGAQLVEGAKYCNKCGSEVNNIESRLNSIQNYGGKVYKCPNCGEMLHSFTTNCPSCGFEFRDVGVSGAVREFELKLEKIEAKRSLEKKPRFLKPVDYMSDTDEEKISLVKNFSIPNSAEDLLEFMILATSNINLRVYDTWNTDITKAEKEMNEAWATKIEQAYTKARYSSDNGRCKERIDELYNNCHDEIRKAKKKGRKKWLIFPKILLGFFALFLVIVVVQKIWGPGAREKELQRLENIEQEIKEEIQNGEYKKALMNTEGLKYDPGVTDAEYDELKRQWKVKRVTLVDEILEEAEKHGIHLEYTMPEEDDDE